eukprot:XP_003728692.1 PREDICTED: uncharacterized protein LOC100893697 [Strongylocentrotus purpuratus]
MKTNWWEKKAEDLQRSADNNDMKSFYTGLKEVWGPQTRNDFTYLGSTVSKDGRIDSEVVKRMSKASSAFGRLRTRLWNNHHVSTRVKCKIYGAIVLSTLLYGAENWTLYKSQAKQLHAFMMRHLRAIMRISWKDKVTNNEVLERANLPSMEDLLIRTS